MSHAHNRLRNNPIFTDIVNICDENIERELRPSCDLK